MKISIVALFPDMIKSYFEESIIKRAIEKGQVEIEYIQLRTFAADSYGTVDDRPYGGGPGMVLKVDVIDRALQDVLKRSAGVKKIISTSPRGNVFNQSRAKEYASVDHLILFAGHYEGMDERAISYFDEEVSLGDFVMTGGEITAAAIIDAVVRLLPGVLKKTDATEIESFFQVNLDTLIKTVGPDQVLGKLKQRGVTQVQLLEYPQYTRPEEYSGMKIPDIIASGNHAEIEKWRLQKAYEVTLRNRPDLLS